MDPDYGGDPGELKYTSRLCMILGGAINWRSMKGKPAAQSTTNAEYNVFKIGCKALMARFLGLEESLEQIVFIGL